MQPSTLTALNELRLRALLRHFDLRHTQQNRELVRGIRWLRRRRDRIVGIYAIVDTRNWWMYVDQSIDIWRRYMEHDRALRRQSHGSLELQADCIGIDGQRWRVLVLEEVRRSELDAREDWWRAHVAREFETEEREQRYLSLQSNRRPW